MCVVCVVVCVCVWLCRGIRVCVFSGSCLKLELRVYVISGVFYDLCVRVCRFVIMCRM